MLGHVVDDLGVDVLVGTENGEAGTFGGAVDGSADAPVAALY
jgi:hypothetical protein